MTTLHGLEDKPGRCMDLQWPIDTPGKIAVSRTVI